MRWPFNSLEVRSFAALRASRGAAPQFATETSAFNSITPVIIQAFLALHDQPRELFVCILAEA